MEPLNDSELNEYLAQWEAPAAPGGMKPPRLETSRWLHWLMHGTIRVPVPAGLAAMVILAIAVYWAVSVRPTATAPVRTVTLSDFEPVKQIEPRIIRSGYEAK